MIYCVPNNNTFNYFWRSTWLGGWSTISFVDIAAVAVVAVAIADVEAVTEAFHTFGAVFWTVAVAVGVGVGVGDGVVFNLVAIGLPRKQG